jgi:hypothetical protein
MQFYEIQWSMVERKFDGAKKHLGMLDCACKKWEAREICFFKLMIEI